MMQLGGLDSPSSWLLNVSEPSSQPVVKDQQWFASMGEPSDYPVIDRRRNSLQRALAGRFDGCMLCGKLVGFEGVRPNPSLRAQQLPQGLGRSVRTLLEGLRKSLIRVTPKHNSGQMNRLTSDNAR